MSPTSSSRLARRLESLLWGRSLGLRRHLRQLRRVASELRYRLRSRRARGQGSAPPTRVVYLPVSARKQPESTAPKIFVDGSLLAQPEKLAHLELSELLTAETPEDIGEMELFLSIEGNPSALPSTALEALLLVLASEPVDLAVLGRSGPADDAAGPDGPLLPFAGGVDGGADGAADGAHTWAQLSRAPRAGESASALVGRRVHHVEASGKLEASGEPEPLAFPPLRESAWHLLRPDIPDGRLLRQPTTDPFVLLRALPPTEDPRPAIAFLLPFLAVGGAERLLYDLLDGLVERCRLLVVTLDPHRHELGQTLDRCRRITSLVYTLGDQLPREARMAALHHLLRRHRVRTLVSWNGTVDFFDHVAELRARHPDLRIASQLYHHRGGWTARTSPEVIASVDLHLAVNRPIVRALVDDHRVDPGRVALVHHGVPIPETPITAEERAEQRWSLGLPADALVVGSFLRLHAQKRPLDIVALARRFADERPALHFLLVGGGPLEAELEAELARGPVPHLLRLPMVPDARPYYAALDLCLMTSEYEGLPVFLLDGLARGLPAVAPAVGDIPLLLGEPGEPLGGRSVARSGDIDGLEQALRELLDDDTRQRAGEAGRRVVREHFGLDIYRRRYADLLLPEEAR